VVGGDAAFLDAGGCNPFVGRVHHFSRSPLERMRSARKSRRKRWSRCGFESWRARGFLNLRREHHVLRGELRVALAYRLNHFVESMLQALVHSRWRCDGQGAGGAVRFEIVPLGEQGRARGYRDRCGA